MSYLPASLSYKFETFQSSKLCQPILKIICLPLSQSFSLCPYICRASSLTSLKYMHTMMVLFSLWSVLNDTDICTYTSLNNILENRRNRNFDFWTACWLIWHTYNHKWCLIFHNMILFIKVKFHRWWHLKYYYDLKQIKISVLKWWLHDYLHTDKERGHPWLSDALKEWRQVNHELEATLCHKLKAWNGAHH